jgi:hypothetical protein
MPEWHSYGNNSTVFVCFDATEMAISIQSAFEELKRSFTRRKVANPHPSWITVETIGGSPPKVLRIELFSHKVSVAAESQEMAIAIKRHDATSEQIERLRQATARFEVTWNTQAYKSLFADLPDLIVEEIEIVQEVVAVLVNFVGGVPVLNGYVVLPLDRDDDLDRATALIVGE